MLTQEDMVKQDDKVASANVDVKDADYDYDPTTIPAEEGEIDQAYLNASKLTRLFRGTLFQMIMFGALSFVGPAMSDAITNLGGGGLSTPYLANLATALQYAMSCVMTLFGGPLINKFGIKWSCMIAAVTFPLAGCGYYVSAKFDVDWYLLFSRVLGGLTSGFLYVGETTAMLSYPHVHERGRYLGIWSAMRNSGSVMGGAINFSTNNTQSSSGGIAWSTYLIFIGFECTGVVWAFLLSKTSKVRRSDGSKVPYSRNLSWKEEFAALIKHAQNKRTWLIFLPAFYSFFYGGVYGTYLSLHFSVRARALSSLIVPTIVIPMVMAYGAMLDNKRWSQKTKGWVAFAMWAIPQAACMIWTGIEYGKFAKEGTIAFDYQTHGRRWAEAYLPYLIIFTTGYWTQLSIYWILGTFSTDVKSSSRTGGLFRAFETAGQAISYAINANTGDKRIPLYVLCAIFALTLPCMTALIRLIPEKPADNDDVADGQVVYAREQMEQTTS
ncbi:hypothetical protein I203_106478 [Kwoniella mangroviensis CBS 8507]|uniref:uncharacterized protein n=1 Tax=Kwoniella mangroviensis CBS 8507 TaxID=1296122 RepID=UPI00080CFBC2|nr:uncharacterized protein I203_07754 [Kwoniella mangroviensis CBS 8507]OCF63329.1 membrane protein [Kwoniella mangroviensis CBS 8507]